jgi:hypothetical protein
MSTSCVRTAWKKVWKKLLTTRNKLDVIIRFVTRLFQQVWYSHDITRKLQGSQHKLGCNSIVISWLYRTYWNNLATTLIMPSSLLQVVNSLFQTCWQLGTSAVNTTCWWLAGRLATRCEILTQSIDKATYHIIWISQENIYSRFSIH